MISDARSTRAFLRLKFTCSQGSPWGGLDVDGRIVRRTESTPAAPHTLTSDAFGVVRDGISETDAIGRRRRERLRQTAGFRAVNSRWVRTRV